MSEVHDRVWEYQGERRANLVRAGVIALFYLVELVNRHGVGFLGLPPRPGVDAAFHSAVTLLAMAWLLGSWGVHALLRERIFPRGLCYLTTAVDAAMVTALLGLADGPRSPLTAAYLLLVALAGLRFNLKLVRAAAAMTALGYWLTCLTARGLRPQFAVDGGTALVFYAAVAGMALIVGQGVRVARAASGEKP